MICVKYNQIHDLGLLQERQRGSQRAQRLPAAIPGCKNLAPQMRIVANGRHHQHRAIGVEHDVFGKSVRT